MSELDDFARVEEGISAELMKPTQNSGESQRERENVTSFLKDSLDFIAEKHEKLIKITVIQYNAVFLS